MKPALKKFIARYRPQVEKALKTHLPKQTEKPTYIHKSMAYSLLAGGKRLRPILVMAGAEICGGRPSKVMPTACALEMIHTYSLIHDDLPAMDNDDLRRGKPTNHKVFGEDMAILAGDALLTRAFSLISSNAKIKGVKPKACLDVLKEVSIHSGTDGMIGGQVADITSDRGRWMKLKNRKKYNIDFSKPSDLLNYIHLKKTAALIQGSLVSGAILAGGSQKQISALTQYGKNIGLAFQVRDDILDVVGDKKKLGKKGSDRNNKKLTYPALYGLPQSKSLAEKYVKAARHSLKPFGKNRAQVLNDLADYILDRDH